MRRKNGFTLLEIVIALAILAIGLVGILSLFPVGFEASRRASMLTEATIHAQQKMEEFKQEGYDYLNTTYTGNTPSGYTDFGDNSGLEWQVTVSEIDPPGNLKSVTLDVRWQEKGSYKNETFVTYIAK
jgi:uncharacterized protein (TIGR02598 family)